MAEAPTRPAARRDHRTAARGVRVVERHRMDPPGLRPRTRPARTWTVWQVVMDGYVRSTHHDEQTALDCAAWWRSLPTDLREWMADLVRCEVAPEWEGLLPQWSRRAVAYPA